MPHSAAQGHRSASSPPLCLFLPLRPAFCLAALFDVWALFCAHRAALRLRLLRPTPSPETAAHVARRRHGRLLAFRAGLTYSLDSAYRSARSLAGSLTQFRAVSSASLAHASRAARKFRCSTSRLNALVLRRLSHTPPHSLPSAPLRPLRGLASRPVLPRPHRGLGRPPPNEWAAAVVNRSLFALRAAS